MCQVRILFAPADCLRWGSCCYFGLLEFRHLGIHRGDWNSINIYGIAVLQWNI